MNIKEVTKECFKNAGLWEKDLEKTYYNHEYYKYKDYLIYAESDDDNTTEYYLVDNGSKYENYFAISFVSSGKFLWDADYDL